MQPRNGVRPFFVILILIASVCASAEQFVLFDTLLVHRGTKDKGEPYGDWESHLNFQYAEGVPKNWKSPVDYYGGKLYWRFEIQEKNTRQKTLYQFCINNEKTDGQYWHCCNGCIKFDTTGVFRNNGEPIAKIWCHVAASWTNFKGYPQLVMKDGASPCTMPICTNRWTKWKGYPNMKLYYPVTILMSAYVVSKGSKFNAPSWWWSARFRKDAVEIEKAPEKTGAKGKTQLRSADPRQYRVISSTGLKSVRVFGIQGKMVDQVAVVHRAHECRIDARSWAPGVYVVEAVTDQKTHTLKFTAF